MFYSKQDSAPVPTSSQRIVCELSTEKDKVNKQHVNIKESTVAQECGIDNDKEEAS